MTEQRRTAIAYAVDFDLVERIAPAVRAHAERTPLVRSEWLSAIHGGDVFLKCENLQVTGSFKVRGALSKLAMAEAEPRGVVAASAGNHGIGLAFAARARGVPCRVIVPRSVPAVKERKIRELGAEVVKSPFDGYDDTEAWARTQAGDAMWVSPFDDPHVIAGNATAALEAVEELESVDAFVVPCGGGGLAVGTGVVARRLCADAAVIGVNSEASPGMWLSRRDGRAHLRVESKPTIAEGIEGGVSDSTYRLGLKYIDDVVRVAEGEIAEAVAAMHGRHGVTVEGAAAAAVAAVAQGRVPRSRRRIVVIVTGSNIDDDRLAQILGRPESPHR